jgi:Family of unknown function (DUF6353)
MKFLPDAIARKVASQQLLASQHAPRILFVGGVVGMVGSTVLACRATLKLEGVLDDIEREKSLAHSVKGEVDSPEYNGDASYSDQELSRDLTVIGIRGVGKVVKLYVPSALLGAISIAALTKSHNILRDRNIALTAAYTAIDSAFTRYRERVIDRYGEEVDRDLRYDSEEIDILDEETGKITTETVVVGNPGAAYARWYDHESSTSWSVDPDINLLFLSNVQRYCNDRLHARGHMFLNEVYAELGLAHTKAGAIVGWRWNKGSGDDYIDFGIWDGNNEVAKDFFNGREGAILLDFNVDGPIYDRLDEDGA